MPLTTPQQKNARSYNAIKNGLYNLNKFISANGSDDLFSLFTENKKTEIDNLFFIPPRQSKPGTSHKGKVVDFLNITNGWFQDPKTDNKTNEIREKVFNYFSFNTSKMMALRQQLDAHNKTSEQIIISQIETFEAKLDKLTPDESFIYINLYISARWGSIVSLFRLQEIQKSLNAKKFIPLSPENYELLKNKKTTENLASQDTSHDLSFSQLGHIKDWPKVKQGILNNLVPPQTDTLSSISTPSSSNTVLNTSINDSINNSPDSTDNSGSITPSIDTQLVINEQAQNQEIVQLKHTKKELEEKSQSLEATKTKLETQISELQNLLQNKEDVLHRESESKRQQLEKLETTITGLRENIKDKDAKLQSLKEIEQKKFLELQSAKLQLQKILNSEDKLNLELKATKTILATAQTQIEEKAQTNANLTIEIKEKNTKLKELSTNLEKELAVENDLILKREVLTKERDALQKTLQNQDELYKNLQSKAVDNATKIIEMNSEISRTNSILTDTQTELNAVTKKYDESKETIDNLQLNKIELEEQNNGLIAQKNKIQTQLSKQKDAHQALVRNHELLIAESTKKDRDLEKQKNVIIKLERELKTKIEQSAQLKEEIKEKDKQIEEQRQKVSKINETLQEKEKEFQEIASQLDTIKHQLREANKGEKTAREKLAANESKMQELEPLKEQVCQAKESYKQLSIKLHSEENKAEQLNQDLNVLNELTASFVQAVQNELNKLNPKEPQTYQELDSIDTKYKINPIDSTIPLDEDVTGTSSNNDRVTEKLDHLKQQLISTLYNLTGQDEKKKQLLEIKKREIDTLRNQYKDLEITANKLINENSEKLTAEKKVLEDRVASLTNQLTQIEEINKEQYQATTPAKYRLEGDWDSDREEMADDYDLTAAYLEELVSLHASLKETKTELEQKNGELKRLQEKLFTQTEESKLNQKELEKEIDALIKSSEKAAKNISTLNAEKENLSGNLEAAKQALQQSEVELKSLKNEQAELIATGSASKNEISEFTQKIKLFEELRGSQENSIKGLTNQIQVKDNEIRSLTTDISKLIEQKDTAIRELQGKLDKKLKQIDILEKSGQTLTTEIEKLVVENESLNQSASDAKEALDNANLEITKLEGKLANLRTNDSSKQEEISEFTKQIDELKQLKSIQEIHIQELNEQVNKREIITGELKTKLKQSDEKLVVSLNQLQELETAKNELENLKLNLESQITELQQKNTELQEELDQFSINDELVAELNNAISIYEDKLTAAEEAVATLKGKLETKQKDDSNLSVVYAKLDKELSEKILELNKIQTELKSTKEQLEEARAKNITQGGLTMPSTQTDLIDLENPMPNQDHPDQVYSKANFPDENGSSSGNSSGHSSSNSHASSESVNASPPPFSHYRNPSSEDEASAEPHSLRTNSSNSSITRSYSLPNFAKSSVSATTLAKNFSTRELTNLGTEHLEERPIINTGTPMPRSEQQDAQVDNTSSIHARGVINAFNEEHHEEIGQAFRAEFSRIATAAANLLFNENIVANADLPTFKNALDEKANKEVQDLILALSNNKKLLSRIIEKIHTNGLNASTYLEEVKNSASFIFGTLQVAQKNYKDHIADIGQDLLIKLCIENLQKEGKANLLQLAKRVLKNRVTINNLQPAEHTETIKIAAEELVTTILETKNIKNIIEAVRNLSITDPNLLEASKQKLQEQLEQEVDQSFDHYFPIVHLNPIFQKIKDGDVLSEEEIQKIPSELQYADTIKDFVSGLRVKYSHLSSDYEGKIDDNNFKNLRLILRKKALVDTNQVIPKDNEIIDLDAKAWLEKKLQLITGKSVNLELVKLEKEQENLLNELSSSLHISTFYDIAITRKTIPELTQEIEKANKAQSSVAEQISQIFKEIENKQTSYPKLIDDEAIAGFEANLNQHLENSSLALAVNNEQAKILLMGINQRLKKDISKWGFLDNKLQKEITNDIANTNGFPFDETATEKLVQHAMLVLRDNYPNETIEKRKQWLKDIALLHAITKKLATFSPKIKENIAKFEDLRVRKEEDINQLEEPAANKIADAVYLPHRHTIIANSLDPNLAKRLPADFELLDGAFYKQDPLQIGQTLTFALSLHNGEEQKCSVTRDETCLAYKIHTPWLNIVNKIKGGVANKMTYARSNTNSSEQFNTEEETLFTLLTHAVNSSKGPTHTIMLGKNCSNEKERFIRLFVEKFNAEQKLSSKKTILLANANDKLKIHSDDKKTIYNKIHKANSLTEELDNATTRTIDTLNRHITRPRG